MEAEQGLISDVKVSSVGPAYATAADTVQSPGNVDLAMKLHYLRGVYYFHDKAFHGLTILQIKEPIFTWLNNYPVTAGRLRRDHSGRPYIKCNDCGVRAIEAKCNKTLQQWFQINDNHHSHSLHKLLLQNKSIGPDLGFSPLFFIQLTKFKCGGTALGLSWAHVLGDAFSFAEFINMLGRVVAGKDLGRPFNLPQNITNCDISLEDPPALKRVGPVGDNWVTPTRFKLEPFSFDVTPTQLSQLQSRLGKNGAQLGPFQAIAAVVWKCIAKIRGEGLEPNVVTICRRNEEEQGEAYGMLRNTQVVNVVKADSPIADAEPSELASLLKNQALDERENINKAMEREKGLADYILYGANLTFLNLEDAEFYDFEYRGQKPVRVSYWMDGVGDEGAVLVLPVPGPKEGGGRVVTTVLPEDEIMGLQSELKKEGLIA